MRVEEEAQVDLNSGAGIPVLSMRRPIVAIDGPAGAGKSTVARHLASRFGLLNLETGAMYRAFALKAQRQGTAFDDASALVALSRGTSIHLEPGEEGNHVFLDGLEVTNALREPAITDGASRVSVHSQIRAWMAGLQQQLAARGGVVMEGRDIGTVVFPNADVKIFLDAAPEVRGLRRYEQIEQAQIEQAQIEQAEPSQASDLQPAEVIRELHERDERDRNRADSPLRAAPDAVIVDSTNLTLAEVVARAEAIVAEKLGPRNSQTSE